MNLYGRSLGDDFADRFLSGPKGGLYGWEQVRQYSEVILVEGLFDYVVLWQAGFHHLTCCLGTHLNAPVSSAMRSLAHRLSHLQCRRQWLASPILTGCVFQNVSQLASWAGVCPGNNESAGMRKSSRIPKGNVYLKTALVEAANAAAKAKGTYLRDKFYRLKARRGYKRATVAIAHKILMAIYHMLSQQVSYNDLGDLYLDKLNKHRLTRNLVHRLERLGYTVTLTLQEKAA